MKDRIKEYIEYKQISAGELAIKLEVQRSNISHILNGRNKPGAAFIEKLLIVFPDLNARWLLTGEGSMLDDSNGKESNSNALPLTTDMNKEVSPALKPIQNDKPKAERTKVVSGKMEDEVDKMILVFTDGTFATYKNREKR